MKLLLAEDEHDLSDALCAILAHEQYEVDAVYDGAEALSHALASTYDGMIFDIMMPKMDGVSVLKELRRRDVMTPVLLLTAKAESADRIDGLDAGADDYLAKPFVMGELLARVRALTRRQREYTRACLQMGNVALDCGTLELSVGTSAVRLSAQECKMLELLLQSQGRPVSEQQLLERVWGEADNTGDRLHVYLSFLETKLGSVGADVKIMRAAGDSCWLESKG